MDVPSKWFRWAVIFFLTAHVALLLDSARKNFATNDEPGHLAAGLSHWVTGTYSMYNVNPPLPRMIAVLPVMLAKPKLQSIRPNDSPGFRAEYTCGREFANENAENFLVLLWLSRLAGIVWSIVGACIILIWATQLYGRTAGLIGMVLWCFDPTILGHASLIMPDIPATVAGLAANYAYWHFLKSTSWSQAGIAGVLLGIALLTKFTLLIFYGVWPLLWLISRWIGPTAGTRKDSTSRQMLQGSFIFGLSILLINIGYAFDRTCCRLDSFKFISFMFTQDPTGSPANRFHDSPIGIVPVPLPAQYLYGIDAQRRDFETGGGRLSYLGGKFRTIGWWHYYLYALMVKIPIGTWILVLLGLALTICRNSSSVSLFDELALWLPTLAIFAFVSSQTGLNRHPRYVFPALPYVLISISKVAFLFRADWWKSTILLVALLFWNIASTLCIHPHYISYFNAIAGGPDNGHDYLLHSSIDWGQDLLDLRAWIEQHPDARPIRIAYCNSVGPQIVGITEFTLPPKIHDSGIASSRTLDVDLLPGFYAVSVNFIRGASYVAINGDNQPCSIGPDDYTYFCYFTPIAKAGYSIYIYHITPVDASSLKNRLLRSSLLAPDVLH